MHIIIDKLVHGGNGIGEIDGKKVFVPYSAPGDELEIAVGSDRLDFANAHIEKIIKPAACRVVPKCPVFGICGGCQWQHIGYETQLECKRDILKEALWRIGKMEDVEILPTLASPKIWNYRNRIQLHVSKEGKIGFYRPKSKEIVEFEECVIAEEKINSILKENRKEFSKRDRGVAIRLDEDEAAFAQVNSGQNEQLKKIIADWMDEIPHDVVLELYAGSGNFTFALASKAKYIVASDIDGRAIKIAWKKQQVAKVCNVEFVCAPAARAAKRLHDPCDLILVDPPRKGCDDAINDIVAIKPKSILYVSCDPATLARDALSLSKHGYKMKKSLPIDMFPQTFHVESLSLFVR